MKAHCAHFLKPFDALTARNIRTSTKLSQTIIIRVISYRYLVMTHGTGNTNTMYIWFGGGDLNGFKIFEHFLIYM